MYRGEKKTILFVLIIYIVSTFVLVGVLSISYIIVEKEKYKQNLETELESVVTTLHKELKYIHENNLFSTKVVYPKIKEYNSAIFDRDKNLLFSTIGNQVIQLDKKIYQSNESVFYVHQVSPYYMGAGYIVVEKKGAMFWNSFDKTLLFIPFGILILVVFTSYSMVKIILKPLRENLKALDDFIKDTTHELNTPIATIQSNLELLESNNLDEKSLKKINRIRTATINIKKLYEDLVFLSLNKSKQSEIEDVDMGLVVEERIEYFKLLLLSKNIQLEFKNQWEGIIKVDRMKMIRIIDNLISNGVKYSNKNTKISIILTPQYFMIQDEGIGMDEESLLKIFERYSRFATDKESGFGIGYNIIYQVIQEYGFTIDIKSQKGEGTCVKIYFS